MRRRLDRPGRDCRRPRARRARAPGRSQPAPTHAWRSRGPRTRRRRAPSGAQRSTRTAFAALLAMESSGQLSATQSKEVLAELIEQRRRSGADRQPARLRADGRARLSRRIVDEVIASNPEEWQRFCAGDEKVAQFLLGQVMRASKSANGKLVAARLPRRRRLPRSPARTVTPSRETSSRTGRRRPYRLRRWPTRSARSRSTAKT